MKQGVREVIEAHERAGRYFEAAGVRSFVLDHGEGDPVVMVHGVPTSSFLYRKVAAELAERRLRAIAFDLPGLGLAQRPRAFDYSSAGLARFTGEVLDALGANRCHLVVHDVGGPIGIEVAIRNPNRVASLTVLNSFIDIDGFRRTWSMLPFAIKGVGEAYLRVMSPVAARQVFRFQGILDKAAISNDEIDAYYHLLKRDDGGRAFLRIMRGWNRTSEHERFLRDGLRRRKYPAQIVWGEGDRAVGHNRRLALEETLGVESRLLPARHFLQEEQAPAIADAVANLAAS